MKQKFFILVVLLLLAGLTTLAQPLKKSSLVVPKPAKELLTPQYIYIPKLKLFLSLQTAPIKNNEWILSEQKTAFFGEGSALPGEQGVSAIFAHAKNGLFTKLPLLEKNDTLIVISEKKLFQYKIEEKQLIEPDELSFLKPRGRNQLAVFTCFGKDDKKRILFLGGLIGELPNAKIKNSLYQI